MALGVMRLLFVTLGELSILSGYFFALGDLCFNASALAVMLGSVVDFSVDEGEELGEVGGGPAFDALKKGMNSRHFFSQFTF